MRPVVPLLLVASLAACSGGEERPAQTALPQAASNAATARPAVVASSAPLMKMAAGTDLVDGVLASWCEAAECSQARGVRPLRYLPGDPNGILLFQSSVAPAGATVELRRNGKVVDRAILQPGTTMAYGSGRRLPEGRYSVVLTASWKKREGRWVFGVVGPLGEEA